MTLINKAKEEFVDSYYFQQFWSDYNPDLYFAHFKTDLHKMFNEGFHIEVRAIPKSSSFEKQKTKIYLAKPKYKKNDKGFRYIVGKRTNKELWKTEDLGEFVSRKMVESTAPDCSIICFYDERDPWQIIHEKYPIRRQKKMIGNQTEEEYIRQQLLA